MRIKFFNKLERICKKNPRSFLLELKSGMVASASTKQLLGMFKHSNSNYIKSPLNGNVITYII